MSRLATAVLEACRQCLPAGGAPLHEPTFAGREREYLRECIDTGWVSSLGSFVTRFERELETLTGAAHAVAVVNGTAALHLCVKLSGVAAADEVLLPSLTFVATANAVSYRNAIPHFVDCDAATLRSRRCGSSRTILKNPRNCATTPATTAQPAGAYGR